MSNTNLTIDDYKETQLSFVCYRKHILKDRHYNLYVLPKLLVMCESTFAKEPKYINIINQSLRIHWKVSSKRQLEAFGILYKNEIKYFNATCDDLLKLKGCLSNKTLFANINELYIPLQEMGVGGFSKVYKVRDKISLQNYAVKCIQKDNFQDEEEQLQLMNEIQINSMLRHPSIVQLYEVFEGDKNFYLIYELLEGKTLQHLIKQKKVFNLQEIQILFKQIFDAVNYIHDKKIMHRDLKPDNMMFKQDGNISSLKIIDFGLSAHSDHDSIPFPKCGTPGYISPEVANLKDSNILYNEKCDIFSLGCILFELITQKPLFRGFDLKDLVEENKKCKIDWNYLETINIAKDAKDILVAMLQINPSERISTRQALQHTFITSIEQKGSIKKMGFQSQKLSQTGKPLWKTQEFVSSPKNKLDQPLSNGKSQDFEECNVYEEQELIQKIPGNFVNYKTKYNKQMIGSLYFRGQPNRNYSIQTKDEVIEKQVSTSITYTQKQVPSFIANSNIVSKEQQLPKKSTFNPMNNNPNSKSYVSLPFSGQSLDGSPRQVQSIPEQEEEENIVY